MTDLCFRIMDFYSDIIEVVIAEANGYALVSVAPDPERAHARITPEFPECATKVDSRDVGAGKAHADRTVFCKPVILFKGNDIAERNVYFRAERPELVPARGFDDQLVYEQIDLGWCICHGEPGPFREDIHAFTYRI